MISLIVIVIIAIFAYNIHKDLKEHHAKEVAKKASVSTHKVIKSKKAQTKQKVRVHKNEK